MPNTPTCIPKSLHTVRVLALMAQQEMNYCRDARRSTISVETAVDHAADQLGYACTPDTYDLKDKAAKQLNLMLQHDRAA